MLFPLGRGRPVNVERREMIQGIVLEVCVVDAFNEALFRLPLDLLGRSDLDNVGHRATCATAFFHVVLSGQSLAGSQLLHLRDCAVSNCGVALLLDDVPHILVVCVLDPLRLSTQIKQMKTIKQPYAASFLYKRPGKCFSLFIRSGRSVSTNFRLTPLCAAGYSERSAVKFDCAFL